MKKQSEKELLQEVENLKIQIEKLRVRKRYGLVWDAEREPEKIVLDCRKKLPILMQKQDKGALISDRIHRCLKWQ